jgi:DNA-binding MarR family transcriptional regulator
MDRISIGREIATTARHLRSLRNRCLHEAGCAIGGAYFHVFMFFARHDGCSEKQAAEAIGKDKTFVTKAVKKLEGQGMVESRRDACDARYKCIFLTPAGKEEFCKTEAVLRRINGIIKHSISDAQIGVFLKTLNAIDNNALAYIEKGTAWRKQGI